MASRKRRSSSPDQPLSAQQPLLVSAPQAADMMGIGTRLLWSETNRRTIPHVRIGRRVLYSVTSLQKWIESREKGSG
jgi:hypothetical protein